MMAAGARNTGGVSDPVHMRLVLRVSVATDEKIRRIAGRRRLKHGPMLRQWIEERLVQEEAENGEQ